MKLVRSFMAAVFALAMLAGAAAPAFAGGEEGGGGGTTAKCNSGRGNGAEVAGADCDPGNSAGHNNGGDS